MYLPGNSLQHFPIPPMFRRVHFYDQFRVLRPHRRLNHGGIDIGGPRGTPVYAATDGRVPHSCVIGGESVPGVGHRPSSSGYYCVIVDDAGYFYYYFHMDKMPTVSPGDTVFAGRRLGGMSNSGRAGRTHLHFQAVHHVRNRTGSDQWYRDLVFPEENLRNVNPFRELRRIAESNYRGVRRGRDPRNGLANVFIPIQ